MLFRFCVLAVSFVFLLQSQVLATDVLNIARKMANEKFAGWTYGSDSSKKQIDCVQFVLAVTEEALAQSLNKTNRNQILIANLSKTEMANLPELILSENEKIKGVQAALVSMKRGQAITPQKAKSGDLIQYWMIRKDGSWFGHAGIIERVTKSGDSYKATLFGSHKSTNGIDVLRTPLILNGPKRKVFIVRIQMD